jgi:NAD(P)H-hydrate epimerase
MVKETLQAPYSHYLLNAELSREIDRQTIEEMNIDSFTLMEVAGSSAAKILLNEETNLTHGVYLLGKGNNAGDALVVARYFLQNDISGTLVFISGTDDLSDDAGKNFELIKAFDSNNQITVCESWDDFKSALDFYFIIDGMLGTGLSSNVRGDYSKAVEWANDQQVPVFSMDIPTGLHSDSGQIMGCAITADRTFGFGSRKQGFYLNEGPSLTGTVDYCELPFPNKYKSPCTNFLLDDDWISIDPPKPGKHKYDSGILYIVAGSEGLTGAAMMAAQSAWAEGLGAVILICPRGILNVYEQNLPSIIKKPVGSRDDYFFSKTHVGSVLEIIREKEGKVLLGPGLGRDESTVEFVGAFLSKNSSDTVIDADGLWCLAQRSEWKKPEQSNWILTPHPGELSQLTNQEISSDEQRLNIIHQFAEEHKLTVLSKGMPGIVGTPSGKCYLTNYNTRYFARAGTGDVLAGKIGAFSALGHSPDISCAMGLLRGKQKLNNHLQNTEGLPEPKDFI